MPCSYQQIAAYAAAQPDDPGSAVQGCPSREHDEQFLLLDTLTGAPVRNRAYEITGPGVYCTGRTDDNGLTKRVYTGGRARKLTVTTLPEEGSIEGPEGDWEGCI